MIYHVQTYKTNDPLEVCIYAPVNFSGLHRMGKYLMVGDCITYIAHARIDTKSGQELVSFDTNLPRIRPLVTGFPE